MSLKGATTMIERTTGKWWTAEYQDKRAAYLASVRNRVLAVVQEAKEPMTAADYSWVLGLPASWTGVEPLVVSPTSVGWILSREPDVYTSYTPNRDNLYSLRAPVVQ